MSYYYSKSTKGFYCSDINKSIPVDAVEITEEKHKELLYGQSTDKEITNDENGYPILIDRIIPPATTEQNKRKAMALLQETDWIELPSISDNSNSPYLVNANEFIIYRKILRIIAINSQEGDIIWPEKPTTIWN
jgi:hypothetical protein